MNPIPIFPPGFDGCATDGELVERFLGGDAAAFELLARRHGDAIAATCGRVCRNPHDADDAAQATLVVLARKAGSVRNTACLAGWLHRVARRAATRAAVRRSRTARRERPLAGEEAAPVEESSFDLRAVIDAEIDRLAERFRLPVVLCYLHGLTTEMAAERLGVPRGTILSRLSTARKTLAARLTRRGVTVPAAAAGLFGIMAARPALAWGGIVPPPSAGILAREVLLMAAFKKFAGWVAASVVVAGLGGTAWGLAAGGGDPPAVALALAPEPPKPAAPPKKADEKPVPPDPAEVKAKEAKLAAIQERLERIVRLERTVQDYEAKAAKCRVEYETHRGVTAPDYDPQVLKDKIAEIDKERLRNEEIMAISGQDRSETLTKNKTYRDTLVKRLWETEADQARHVSRLEQLKRDMLRYERLATDLAERLEYLRLDLAPPAAALTTDSAVQKLIEEVAELRAEVRRLAAAKK